MRICTVIGARPQFVKAAMVRRALDAAGIEEVLVHSGQHYDKALSQVFFDELDIPAPQVNLHVGSGLHGHQTATMMIRLEEFIVDRGPFDILLVYGDTNSTLAGALVAAKLHIPVAHVEAGLRSFDRSMPEEINRVLTDHVSCWLFCPTETAVNNLRKEGITEGVHLVGDVMLEASLFFAKQAAQHCPLSSLTTHQPGGFMVATIHRAANTDDPERLAGIFEGLGRLGVPILLPLHPRTRTHLQAISIADNIELREPASYLEMLVLVSEARCVLTDSGGLQKEAYWLQTPCVTLRAETEWLETLHDGWNICVGANPDSIVAATTQRPTTPTKPFGRIRQEAASSLITRLLLSG